MHFLVLSILLAFIMNGVESQNRTLTQIETLGQSMKQSQILTLTQGQSQNYVTLTQKTQVAIPKEIDGVVEEIINAVAPVEENITMGNSTQSTSFDLMEIFSSVAEFLNGFVMDIAALSLGPFGLATRALRAHLPNWIQTNLAPRGDL